MSKIYSIRSLLFAALLAACAIASSASADEAAGSKIASSGSSAEIFPDPPGLGDAVKFWRQVFGIWRRNQIALHDDEHLGAIYDIIDLPGPSDDGLTSWQKKFIKDRREALESRLRDMEHRVRNDLPLDAEQQRLHDAIVEAAGKYAVYGAARRLRSQRGMRERFLEGLKISGRYREEIRQVFKDAGLPSDLAYLPHIESSFVNHARSHAGATGVWQFMRSTAVRYLMINSAVDERLDPALAACGAARYLAGAYDRLGDWGLAITSYNHGVNGMAEAKRQHGADIEKIVRHYKSRLFGFASRNFYAEFLAVRSIINDVDTYFPEGVRFEAPLSHARVRLIRSATLPRLADLYGVKYSLLKSINPALTPRAADGRISLPAGAELWLPQHAVANAGDSTAYAHKQELFQMEKPVYLALQVRDFGREAAAKSKQRASGKKPITHTVRKGESPHRIASKYGVRVREMMALNDLKLNAVIRPGERLRIPAK